MSIPLNMGTEKGPKVTLWQANQALVFWHHSHPSGTLIWFQRPFAFHLWLSKVINLPYFPRRWWLTTENRPCKRKEQHKKWATAFWFEQMLWTVNTQCQKCPLCTCANSVYLVSHFFNAWQMWKLLNANTTHAQKTYFVPHFLVSISFKQVLNYNPNLLNCLFSVLMPLWLMLR